MFDLTQKGDPYLLPYDGDRSAVEETAWSLSDLKKLVKLAEPAKVVSLVDACYTGEGRSLSAPDARPGVVRVRDSEVEGGNGVVISASRSDQASWDHTEAGHGLFTWFLLKGLRGAAAAEDGFVYQDGLFEYLKREVPPMAKRLKGADQNPVLSGLIGKVPLTKAVR